MIPTNVMRVLHAGTPGAPPGVSLHPTFMDPLAAPGVFRESWQARWPWTSGVRESSDHGWRTGADVPLSQEAKRHGVMAQTGSSSSSRRRIKRGPDTSKVSSSSTEAPELFQDTNHSSNIFAAFNFSNDQPSRTSLYPSTTCHPSNRPELDKVQQESTRGRRGRFHSGRTSGLIDFRVDRVYPISQTTRHFFKVKPVRWPELLEIATRLLN
ncbi:hypothetical protein IWZ00DRAFT_122712 [Phyllosticta capitalensis]|uniref:uncharacterized protein n=1 Tax=Phyllosticta capitalensis TaxID=121624 RepID=UPI0031300D43